MTNQEYFEDRVKAWAEYFANNLPPVAARPTPEALADWLDALVKTWERRKDEYRQGSPCDTYNCYSLAREVERCIDELRAKMESASNESRSGAAK